MRTTAGWIAAALAILVGALLAIPAALWALVTGRKPFWLYMD